MHNDLNHENKTIRRQRESTPKAILIDVRRPSEFSAGTLQGAQNMDITSVQFQQALKKLDKDKVYFLFCRSGTACKNMSEHGFTVYNLAGGISAWLR